METENKMIALTYTLTGRAEGEESWDLVESTEQGRPFEFITGMGMTLDDFEAQVAPLAPGSEFDFTLTPLQAYGPRFKEAVKRLPREMFMIDGKLDHRYIYEGAVVPLTNSDGETFNGTITGFSPTEIEVDLNHPLAGMELRFKGAVLESRPATLQEMERMANMMSGEGCCGGCGGEGGCEGGCGGGCGGCK